jgi:hypothetical protein
VARRLDKPDRFASADALGNRVSGSIPELVDGHAEIVRPNAPPRNAVRDEALADRIAYRQAVRVSEQRLQLLDVSWIAQP